MRLSPLAAAFAFACALFTVGLADAATVAMAPDADGTRGALTVAPPFIGHVAYVPVATLPEISNALIVPADASAPTATGSDMAGVPEAAPGAASQDPQGKVLFVWLWLLPASGALSITAYLLVMAQMNRSWAAAAARRGVAPKKVGFFV